MHYINHVHYIHYKHYKRGTWIWIWTRNLNWIYYIHLEKWNLNMKFKFITLHTLHALHALNTSNILHILNTWHTFTKVEFGFELELEIWSNRLSGAASGRVIEEEDYFVCCWAATPILYNISGCISFIYSSPPATLRFDLGNHWQSWLWLHLKLDPDLSGDLPISWWWRRHRGPTLQKGEVRWRGWSLCQQMELYHHEDGRTRWSLRQY